MALFTLLTSGSSAAGAARTRAAGAVIARAGTCANAAVLGSWRGGRTSATVPRGSNRANTAVRLVVMDRPSGKAAEAAARVTACDTTPRLLHSRLRLQRQQGLLLFALAGAAGLHDGRALRVGLVSLPGARTICNNSQQFPHCNRIRLAHVSRYSV